MVGKYNINSFHKVGKYNGLTLLLDAETYDYMYQASLIDAYILNIYTNFTLYSVENCPSV